MSDFNTRPGWSTDGRVALVRHADVDAEIEAAIDRCIKRHLLPLGLNDVEASTIARRGAAALDKHVKIEPVVVSMSTATSVELMKQIAEDPERLRHQAHVHAMRLLRADVLRSAWFIIRPTASVEPPLAALDCAHPFVDFDDDAIGDYIFRHTGERLRIHQLEEWSTSISARAAKFGWQLLHGTAGAIPRAREDAMRRITAGMLIAFAQVHQANDWAARTIACREVEGAVDPQAHVGPVLE